LAGVTLYHVSVNMAARTAVSALDQNPNQWSKIDHPASARDLDDCNGVTEWVRCKVRSNRDSVSESGRAL
jgi:hypothetical protein